MVRLENTPGDGKSDGARLRIAVIRSRFNEKITQRLLDGALAAFRERGIAGDRLLVLEVPGAVELALAAKLAIEHEHVDAVVCLGAVIRGQTDHYDHVCRIAGDSIARVALDTGVPVSFGVLTCEDEEQALARSGSPGGAAKHGGGSNRGHDAACAALEMAYLHRKLRS
jgi:6,7-dimethyl-8-ribityllumazine synthase